MAKGVQYLWDLIRNKKEQLRVLIPQRPDCDSFILIANRDVIAVITASHLYSAMDNASTYTQDSQFTCEAVAVIVAKTLVAVR